MVHNYSYVCNLCGNKTEVPVDYSAGDCSCGGTYEQCGEVYDQEFVDERKYNEQQDREYEYRHRNDRW